MEAAESEMANFISCVYFIFFSFSAFYFILKIILHFAVNFTVRERERERESVVLGREGLSLLLSHCSS